MVFSGWIGGSALKSLLRAAERDEKEEFEDVYPSFWEYSKSKGFLEAASAFFQIAEIEHTHQERFRKVAEMLENSMYYNQRGAGTMDLYKLRIHS